MFSFYKKKDELYISILTNLLVILALFLWIVKKSRKVTAPLLPGPRGLPVVGYLPFLGTQLHRKFTELALVYGPIYKLWLGHKLCVVISSPSLAKEVVRGQDSVFSNRDPPIAALATSFGGADITFSSYGPSWQKLRKLFVREMLSKASIDACYALRREEVKKTITDVYDKIGKPIDIGELAFLTATNVIMNMLWGGSLRGEKGTNVGAELREVAAQIMVLVEKPNVSDFFPELARFDIQGIERQAKKLTSWCEQIFDTAIEGCTNLTKLKGKVTGKDEQEKDFLQFLLELKEKEVGELSITMTQLKALLMDIVIGGTDSTSTIVEWVMVRLMQHPKVMAKVHEELTEVVGVNNVVEEFHLPKLLYLDAVVKETFRLHPVAPLLVPRCPSLSCTVGGYNIPKGTRVFLNVWAIHRDPQLWVNPLEFQPERFLIDPGKFDYKGNNFQYMPFGSGRRICAGFPLGQKMVMYVLASMLHMFEWKLPYGTELELSDKFGLVTKKMRPLVAIPTPRLSKLELYT